MARADLLLDLVRAGASGDRDLFRRALEALVAEERARQHHVLADRLAAHLQPNGTFSRAPEAGVVLRKQETRESLYYETTPERRLKDLILPAPVLAICHELVEEQHRSDILRSHNLEPRHRVLLIGPPGNGKTSLAEALASELGVPFVIVRYEAVIASFLGETAVRLSRLFEQVRTRQCVLFFDEFDVVGKERGDVHETGEIKRVVSSLLLQIDALPSYVVVVTATNHPELLDRAVWRRFQLRLELPPPSEQCAQDYLRRRERLFGQPFGVGVAAIARRLRGLSFAELEQFAEDVQRRFILGLPEAKLKRIVEDRLAEWQGRASPHKAQGKR